MRIILSWALLISKEDIQISYMELIELPHHNRLLRNYILISDKSSIVAIGLNFIFICNVAIGTMYLIYIV